jgi:Tfp pilus assembly protein PilP
MNTRRLFAALACGGALALLGGCQGGGTPAPPAPAAKKAPPAPAAKAPAGPVAAAATPPAPSAPTYDPARRRDPFIPLVVARVATARPKTGLASLDPADLKLTGIVWDKRGYYALVEAPNGLGYVIRLNDVIGEDARVMKITPEGMTLEVEARGELPREKSSKRLVEIRLRKEEEH